MTHVVNTKALIEEGVLTSDQGAIIVSRSRRIMVSLGINTLLCLGILLATGGFIVWLGTPLSVALTGIPMLAAGVLVLTRGGELYRMFGHAATLVGGGMLLGGAALELLDKMEQGPAAVLVLGALVGIGAGLLRDRTPRTLGFPLGMAIVAGAGTHLLGLYEGAEALELPRGAIPPVHLYAAALTAFVGWRIDVRFVTALAIVPFAQMLDTGTAYWHAAYVFYSPESTLTILQMAALAGACIWAATKLPERHGRHGLMLGMMAVIVANLAFLVGSLWGDVPGSQAFGPRYEDFDGDWEAYRAAQSAFTEGLFEISEDLYSIVWAVVLIGAAVWSAHTARRGMFNAAMTFGGIHAYTQMFETFYDAPLAYVIGGLAAVPLAWGLWRLNQRWDEEPAAVN